jgi:hypothetical protein
VLCKWMFVPYPALPAALCSLGSHPSARQLPAWPLWRRARRQFTTSPGSGTIRKAVALLPPWTARPVPLTA